MSSYARSGIGPRARSTRGEIAIGSTVLHGVIDDIVEGFPVKPVLPCEGVGYEVGSMAIIKGARNPEAARKFVDWALTVDAQKIGLDLKEYAIPTNKAVPLPAQVPKPRRLQGHRLRLRQVRRGGASASACSPAGRRIRRRVARRVGDADAAAVESPGIRADLLPR